MPQGTSREARLRRRFAPGQARPRITYPGSRIPCPQSRIPNPKSPILRLAHRAISRRVPSSKPRISTLTVTADMLERFAPRHAFRPRILTIVLLSMSASGTALAFQPAERPFLFMNREEIEGARRRLEKPWAEPAMAAARVHNGRAPMYADWAFRILVHGDEREAEAQKRQLLGFVGATTDGTHPRTNRLDMALRYDILYDRLTEEERKGVEDTFRRWIRFHLDDYWRGRERVVMDGEERDTRYTRTNWLPNMHHPRGQGIFLMAVALQDEGLIRECFATPVAGFKWWMDEYLADGQFYMEEFLKKSSTFGKLLLLCRGVERLGLGELGFGYVGENDRGAPGGSMRRYLDAWIHLGLPARPAPEGGTSTFPGISMGDVGPFTMIRGYGPDDRTPRARWQSRNMNGPLPYKDAPLWFEIAHAQWPDGGYDWVLAQKRMPGQDRYYPSLYFNLDPVDPADTRPFPVTSYIAPERGFGLMRMEEGPGHWFSPRPAAALQFGMYYVHYVHDCFTLMHYIAHRQPMYGWRAFGPHRGYAGNHPWRDSVRAYNGVVVDSMQIKPVDDGNRGAEHTGIRHRFDGHARFLAIDAIPREIPGGEDGETRTVGELYPGTAVERLLCLTDEYLFDVIRLRSDRERVFHWNHHPHGQPDETDAEAWAPSSDLDGGKLFENMGSIMRRHPETVPGGEFDLPAVHKRDMGDRAWNLAVIRGEGEPGVVIRMLGGQPTTVYRDIGQGVTTLIVERRGEGTTFVVLHEPVKGGSRIASFDLIAETEEGIAVRVRGEGGLDDIILVAFAQHADREITLGAGDQAHTFRNFAHIRRGDGRPRVAGELVGSSQ